MAFLYSTCIMSPDAGVIYGLPNAYLPVSCIRNTVAGISLRFLHRGLGNSACMALKTR